MNTPLEHSIQTGMELHEHLEKLFVIHSEAWHVNTPFATTIAQIKGVSALECWTGGWVGRLPAG